MGLEIMLFREPAISLEDWKSAVASTPGVELIADDHVVVNPASGEEIRIPARDGEARAGTLMLRWRSFAVTAGVPSSWPDDPVADGRAAMFELARRLGCSVMTEHEEPIREHP